MKPIERYAMSRFPENVLRCKYLKYIRCYACDACDAFRGKVTGERARCGFPGTLQRFSFYPSKRVTRVTRVTIKVDQRVRPLRIWYACAAYGSQRIHRFTTLVDVRVQHMRRRSDLVDRIMATANFAEFSEAATRGKTLRTKPSNPGNQS